MLRRRRVSSAVYDPAATAQLFEVANRGHMEDYPASLELWGGIECTIARIGDIWRNQISETGHHERSCDIDRIVDLGIKTIRYPILWEEISPRHPDKFDFGWTDARLGLLREKGVKVIGGLLHHGSGPRSEEHTSELHSLMRISYA